MHIEAPVRIRLHAGDVLHLPVDRQATIQVAHGAVVVRDVPHWIGEQMFFPRGPLGEGQVHRFAQTGWIEIVAQRDAELLCRAAPRPAAAWWRACVGHWTWLRGAVLRH